eukprot:TRINITY_DN8361_c0_g1_i1.p1 TRINITY_DN8361_c0_g1~~TRINITY_DN8361_c0_g1_i1.p1  ORF type:complete len:144 (+),score=21.81 TRINITY_DN8361_c0_g1_i1:68-499(+)
MSRSNKKRKIDYDSDSLDSISGEEAYLNKLLKGKKQKTTKSLYIVAVTEDNGAVSSVPFTVRGYTLKDVVKKILKSSRHRTMLLTPLAPALARVVRKERLLKRRLRDFLELEFDVEDVLDALEGSISEEVTVSIVKAGNGTLV